MFLTIVLAMNILCCQTIFAEGETEPLTEEIQETVPAEEPEVQPMLFSTGKPDNTTYTVEFELADELKQNYILNKGGNVTSITESRTGRFNYSFGAFLKSPAENKYIKMVTMEMVSSAEGVSTETGEPVWFEAGEIISALDGNGDAKAVPKLAYTQFPEGTNIQIRIHAVYHTVLFQDDESNMIEERHVVHGMSVRAPEPPEKPYRQFAGWDADLSNVTDDMTVTALYEWTHYQVNYQLADILKTDYTLSSDSDQAGEKSVCTEWIPAGEALTDFRVSVCKKTSDTKERITALSMTMMQPAAGQNEAGGLVEFLEGQEVSELVDNETGVVRGEGGLGSTYFDGGAVIEILVSAVQHEVVFYSKEETEPISRQSVFHGQAAVEPEAVPEIEGKEFTNWDKSFGEIKEDTVVLAVYDNKSVVPDKPVEPGKPVVPEKPIAPEKPMLPEIPVIPAAPVSPDTPNVPAAGSLNLGNQTENASNISREEISEQPSVSELPSVSEAVQSERVQMERETIRTELLTVTDQETPLSRLNLTGDNDRIIESSDADVPLANLDLTKGHSCLPIFLLALLLLLSEMIYIKIRNDRQRNRLGENAVSQQG